MFTLLAGAIFEIVLFCIAVVVLYKVFLAGFIHNKLYKIKCNKQKKSESDKLAYLKLISDNYKEIESFVSFNANYLSEDMVKKLVNRIEYLKADLFIKKEEYSLLNQNKKISSFQEIDDVKFASLKKS